MDRFWLTDEQFANIAPHLPTDTRGKERVDDCRVISGIVHVLKSGGRWADALTEVYGPKKTLYNRFVRWAAKGVWTGLFEALASAGGLPAHVLIDSSAVKADGSKNLSCSTSWRDLLLPRFAESRGWVGSLVSLMSRTA